MEPFVRALWWKPLSVCLRLCNTQNRSLMCNPLLHEMINTSSSETHPHPGGEMCLLTVSLLKKNNMQCKRKQKKKHAIWLNSHCFSPDTFYTFIYPSRGKKNSAVQQTQATIQTNISSDRRMKVNVCVTLFPQAGWWERQHWNPTPVVRMTRGGTGGWLIRRQRAFIFGLS